MRFPDDWSIVKLDMFSLIYTQTRRNNMIADTTAVQNYKVRITKL
ncbi:MAG: hypothetical protein AMDU4_FER2C00009G0003 [Ferroplasma sp. Type II]|nr:MAG: hypothetical protein AMDU4_FER2C00009G0003 [Ferroplasma sp. Type II]